MANIALALSHQFVSGTNKYYFYGQRFAFSFYCPSANVQTFPWEISPLDTGAISFLDSAIISSHNIFDLDFGTRCARLPGLFVSAKQHNFEITNSMVQDKPSVFTVSGYLIC